MNSSAPPATAKKRRSTSIPFILGVVLLGGLAYYFEVGKHIMTYVMYQQEKAKSASYMKDTNRVAASEELATNPPEVESGPGKPPEDDQPVEVKKDLIIK